MARSMSLLVVAFVAFFVVLQALHASAANPVVPISSSQVKSLLGAWNKARTALVKQTGPTKKLSWNKSLVTKASPIARTLCIKGWKAAWNAVVKVPQGTILVELGSQSKVDTISDAVKYFATAFLGTAKTGYKINGGDGVSVQLSDPEASQIGCAFVKCSVAKTDLNKFFKHQRISTACLMNHKHA